LELMEFLRKDGGELAARRETREDLQTAEWRSNEEN